MDVKPVVLRELCATVEYGYTASASHEMVGPQFLRITDIVPELIDWSAVPRCEIEPKKMEKFRLRNNDIVIARTGATVGYAKRLKNPPEAVFASYLVRLTIDPAKAEPAFIGALVESHHYKDFVIRNAGGAAQPNANAQILTSYQLYLPDLPTQRRIASILSAYDDLIENNTRRIAILEEMARRIYEEWFARFRFPGHEQVKMVESELGLTPEGWQPREVKDVVVRLSSGKVFKEADVQLVGQIPVIDQSTSELLGFHDEEAAHNASAKSPVVIFGDHTCKMQLMVTPFSLGPNTVPFVAKDLPVHYVFSLVRGLVSTHEYKRHWSDLMKKRVLVASQEVATKYADLVRPMSEQIETLRRKSRNLRTTRDLLLPKLISGELDVSGLPEPEALAA